VKVTSCDPIYALPGDQIGRCVEACRDAVLPKVRENRDEFVWELFPDPDALAHARITASGRFLADFEAGKTAGRYVTASLPQLPFADDEFDLCLCSNLLFLYSDLLDLHFHTAAIIEMTRVAPEVRVFPLLNVSGEQSAHLEQVMKMLTERGHQAALVKVDYELQRGGNRMLRINGL
jgi:hypothetical protein